MTPIAEFFTEILIEGIFRNTWNILKAIYRFVFLPWPTKKLPKKKKIRFRLKPYPTTFK